MEENKKYILGYGEDSLTLVYLQNKEKRKELFDRINSIEELKDVANDDCIIFYRPSFGRKYGPGEPDFIIFNQEKKILILGESKWNNINIKNLKEQLENRKSKISSFFKPKTHEKNKNTRLEKTYKEFIKITEIKDELECKYLILIFYLKNNFERIKKSLKTLNIEINYKDNQPEYAYYDKETKDSIILFVDYTNDPSVLNETFIKIQKE